MFKIGPTDALIIIDPQNDFVPGGALAVTGGDEIMADINDLSWDFRQDGGLIVLTQDWHPNRHKSFASTHELEPFTETDMPYGKQTLWPDHCVQGTKGSDFHPDIDGAVARAALIIRKGMNPDIDSYSAFVENDQVTKTGLAGYLRDKGIKRCIFVGLAFDFCVAYSALDAIKEGFESVVLQDLTRAIAMPVKVRQNGPDGPFDADTDTATVMEGTMRTSGVSIIDSGKAAANAALRAKLFAKG